MRFWDSSAIVPLLVAEPTRELMLRMLTGDPEMVVWWGAPIECASALARREREGFLSAADATRAIERMRELSLAWNEVLPSEAVRGTAQRLLRVHPLRAGDALQLAAAIVGCEHDPLSFAFLSLDERLNEAAQREGFRLAGG